MPTISARQLLKILTNRNVLLLAISYLCMNYSFYLLSNWVFLYLVQERKFSVLESGWLASTPPLAAAVGAGIGGLITGGAVPALRQPLGLPARAAVCNARGRCPAVDLGQCRESLSGRWRGSPFVSPPWNSMRAPTGARP